MMEINTCSYKVHKKDSIITITTVMITTIVIIITNSKYCWHPKWVIIKTPH